LRWRGFYCRIIIAARSGRANKTSVPKRYSRIVTVKNTANTVKIFLADGTEMPTFYRQVWEQATLPSTASHGD